MSSGVGFDIDGPLTRAESGPSDRALVDAIAERVTLAVLQRLEGVLPLRSDRRLSSADIQALGGLLPVMWAVCGTTMFSVAELMAHAQLHPGLQQAISSATGRVPAEASKSLGRLFRRSAGVVVHGLQVHRLGDAGGAAVWSLGFTPTPSLGFQGFETTEKPKRAETGGGRSPTTAA